MPQNELKIAVVGAGPSGLRTAMLLEAEGHQVEIFEARDRVGGRLKTIKTERGFYDAGGEWIDGDHFRIIELLKSFGQEPELSTSSEGVVYFDGVIHQESELETQLESELEKFYEQVDMIALDLESPPWINSIYGHLDGQDLASDITKSRMSPLATKYLRGVLMSDEGEELSRISYLGWLTGYRQYLERAGNEMSAFRFPNGAQGFCEDMANHIKGAIHLNSPVVKFSQNAEFATLTTAAGTWKFDQIVMAIPSNTLCKISGFEHLSQAKQVANEESCIGRTVKVAMRFKTRFWRNLGFSGRLLTDMKIQQCWDGSRGDEAVLLAYINGDATEFSISGNSVFEEYLDELERVFPGAKEEFLDGEVHDWISDPFAGGGFSYPAPGHVMDRWQSVLHSELRLHFAGEHACENWGFIEGALESAERVAQEILNKK